MNIAAANSPRVFEGRIEGRQAWIASEVTDGDWRMSIPRDALAEIDEVIAILKANPLDVRALSPEDYPLAACRAMMQRVRQILDEGVGMVVMDRLSVSRYTKEELTWVYWLLSSMIARPVAQSFDGRLLYDVRDTGAKTATRVRGDLTSQELSWHSDYGFNFPPPYLGLLVLRTAREGGISSAGSMMTVHNVLRERDPDLLRRLYEPFYWNRQGEHPEGDPVTHFHGMFQYDGKQVRARYNQSLIPKGYELVGKELDERGKRAIRTVSDILFEPEHHITFVLEPGQLQFVNNFKMAHLRTEYVDHDEPDAKRHLIRIFLRDFGRRSYMG
jgi:hypothetical protein